MSDSMPQPETILRLGNAPFPSLAMVAGMQLELFTPLGKGPMTAAELAAALGVKESKLAPLLYALVSAGLLTLDGERFANTAEADHYLVKGKSTYLGERHFHYAARYREVMQTAATIRTGVPQVKRDFSAMSADEFEHFLRGLHPAARAAGRELAERFDFSGRSHMADVGGGSGGLAMALAAACPHLRVTVIDFPQVTTIAQRFIAEEAMAQQVDAIAGDSVSAPLPGRYDGAVLRSVIQVLSSEEAARLFRNLAQVLEPGSPLYIIGQILDDSRISPAEMVAFNLVFINQHNGQAYTEGEYRAWLTDAGFCDIERTPFGGGSSLITARMPG